MEALISFGHTALLHLEVLAEVCWTELARSDAGRQDEPAGSQLD